MLNWIRQGLPLWIQIKGYYVLPALAMLLVAGRYAVVRRRGAGPRKPERAGAAGRLLDAALLALAALSIVVYSNFFNYHYGGFLNSYEFFHYYLGSKYAREIGYFDLYEAALVADEETGRLYRPEDGLVSDLRTYGYRPVADVLAERERVRSRFSSERWREWVRDVSFFKSRMGPEHWSRVLRDKGYNATPVWTMAVGGLLSSRVPTSSEAGMTLLALLDVLLLAAAASFVGATFGRWPALLMVIFIGSSYLMAHVHMKGAYLRTDFVVCLVVATCMLARKRHGIAGALVACSATARIFPAIFLFGPAAKLAWELVPVAREAARRLRKRGAGIRGALLALGSLLAAALLLQGGWLALGSGTREVVLERFGSWGGLFALALVPTAVLLGAGGIALWGAARGLLDPRHLWFFGGFILTVGALVGASLVWFGGASGWEGFARKIALHRTVYNHWNVGLESVVIAEFDPPGPRSEALARRPPSRRHWLGNVFFRPESEREGALTLRLLQLAALVLGLFAVRRLPESRAFAFGFVPTFFLIAPTYYYYVVLLLPLLFFAVELERLRGALGVAYLFLSGSLGFAFYFRWDQYFTTTYWNSVLALGLALSMIGAALSTSREAASRGPASGRA